MTDYENSEMTTHKHQEEKEKERQKESVKTKENVELNAVLGSVSGIKNRASSPQEQQNLKPELKVTSKQNEQLGGTTHEAKKKRIDHFVLEKDIIEFESAAANISDSLLRLEAEKMKLHTDMALAIATSVKVLRTAVNNILSCYVVKSSVKDVNEEMQQLVHDLVQFIRNLKV